MKRWLVGNREYCHPVFQWLIVPATRIAVLLIALPTLASTHARWIAWVGLGILVVSAIADLLNDLLLRRRRRRVEPFHGTGP